MAVPHSRAAGKRLRAENVLRLPCLCSRSCLPRGIQNVIHTLPQNHTPVKLNEKEIHLLEQKGYERMMNEIMPVQQAEVYRKPTKKVVEEAVKELNPDTNSLGSRG